MRVFHISLPIGIVTSILCLATPSFAQDLEPRAYSSSPVGLNFLVASVGRSSGGVLVDLSLPVESVLAELNSLALGYGRTFSLFGLSALATVALPYVWAEASGQIGEATRSVTRSGLADARTKLSVNLLGRGALTPAEFVRTPPARVVGASLTVAPPTGQYYPSKLINLGANRWSVKPEVGASFPRGRWTLEGYAGIWFFTDNEEFYTGASHRQQDRVISLQGHLSYTVRPQLWIAFDGTWYSGGTTTVDHVRKADVQRNSRLGATVSFPLRSGQSLKFASSTGATTRLGNDFNTFALVWQVSWL
ncbi:MAG: transporter, partial [Acidobacteria bacterium]